VYHVAKSARFSDSQKKKGRESAAAVHVNFIDLTQHLYFPVRQQQRQFGKVILL
jgi:hypothetical protein